MMNYTEFLTNYLENLSNDELLTINNELNEYEPIYYNDEDFFEMFPNGYEVAKAVYFGDYNYSHEFIKIDDLGNIQSSDYIDDLIDIDNLVYILEENNYLKDELSN